MPLHTENDTAQSIPDLVHTGEQNSGNAGNPSQESDAGSVRKQVLPATIPAIEASNSDHSDVASVHSHSSHAPSVKEADTASRSGSSYQSRNHVRSAMGEVEPSSMAEFDVMRFRNNYFQAVEELRMRRALDTENEDKIKKLIAGKHQLQQKYDDVERSYHKALDQCSNQEQEMRRKFANQMKQMEEEKTRQSCSEENREMEIKALKDEIRALHLAKYNVEKKVEEQERQLQLQSSSRESFMAEVSQLEQKCHTAMSQGSEVMEQMTHLETNVKQAVELNRKLQYVNEHQKCILEGYKRELESCRQQLVDTRVSLADRQAEVVEAGEQTGRRTRATEQDLKMHTELTKQLQLQLSSLREEHQGVLQQLKEAHSLIDKHVESNSRLQSSEGLLKEEVASLQECNEKLQTDLTALQQEITLQTDERVHEKQQLITKSAEIERRLRSLQEDYTALQESHDRLEADSKARVTELESQLVDMVGREKRWEEKVVQEKESLVEEWEGKVRLLERSLEKSEACIQERKKCTQDEKIQVPEESGQDPAYACSPQSIAAISKTNESECIECDNEDTAQHAPKPESPHKKESHGAASVLPLPSPPKSQVLSPEVISPSSSPNTEQEYSVSKTTKLPSPRVHLERVQLSFNRRMQSCHGGKDSEEAKGSERSLISGEQLESHQSIEHSQKAIVHSTPGSPVAPKRKVQNHSAAAGDGLAVCDTPSKKQKIANPCQENENSLLGRARNTTSLLLSPPSQEATASHSSLSQPTHMSGTGSFLPLSQPCHSNAVSATHTAFREKRRSSLRGLPWKLEIPKPPVHVTRQLNAEEKSAVSPSRTDGSELSKAGSSTFQASCTPRSLSLSPRHHTTQSLSYPKKASSPLTESNSKLQLEMSLSPPLQTTGSKTINTINENIQHQGAQPSEGSHLPAIVDQSVPDPTSVDNFPVVFSEGEDDGENSDSLISSQMHRQIHKVHTFLKMDRLRRTKVSDKTSSNK